MFTEEIVLRTNERGIYDCYGVPARFYRKWSDDNRTFELFYVLQERTEDPSALKIEPHEEYYIGFNMRCPYNIRAYTTGGEDLFEKDGTMRFRGEHGCECELVVHKGLFDLGHLTWDPIWSEDAEEDEDAEDADAKPEYDRVYFEPVSQPLFK